MAKYTLKELVEKSGVAARTIRYYISRNILPGAVGKGRRSHYTGKHLGRLREVTRRLDAGATLGSMEILQQTITTTNGPPMTITFGNPWSYDLGHGVSMTLNSTYPLPPGGEARLAKALLKAAKKTLKKMQKEN